METIERREAVIRYDERFREYLLKDRGLSEGTTRNYMNCLRRLDGKAMNYDLMSRKIPCSRWMVKDREALPRSVEHVSARPAVPDLISYGKPKHFSAGHRH